MKIGIIGTGNIGSNLARLFVAAGHEVVLSWSRSPEKLVRLSIELGNHKRAKAASVLEATQDVDISILSIRFMIMDEIKKQMGDVTGKIIVDTNNPYDIKLPTGVSAAAEVCRRLKGIRIVKAFNSLRHTSLLTCSHTDPLTISPLCSDDDNAKELVKTVITSIGYDPFDLGGLENVFLQEPGGPFYNIELSRQRAEKLKQND
ncbi:MAG: NAD(P)-binding domain-containing protein [Rhizobacter sp.]|nr:NAD(P)-binding domain-containing protein [Ferruginibacter sp.]